MAAIKHPMIHVIIVAAGIGSRFSNSDSAAENALKAKPKQYQMIGNQSVLAHSICAFNQASVNSVTVVLNPTDPYWEQQGKINCKHNLRTTDGGAQRHDSVRNGIKSLAADPQDWIIVHDAARPCVSAGEIDDLIQTCLSKQQGGLLVKPISDTIKQSHDGTKVDLTLDRNQLFAALTPQMFRCGDLLKALTVYEAGCITDESSALEAQGHHPLMVIGKSNNLKITTFEDLAMAEAILKQQGRIQ